VLFIHISFSDAISLNIGNQKLEDELSLLPILRQENRLFCISEKSFDSMAFNMKFTLYSRL